MQLNDTAIVLNTRKYNDSSIIMKVITENNGIYSGLVRIKKNQGGFGVNITGNKLNLMWRACLLYTSPSPRDLSTSRMPSSA